MAELNTKDPKFLAFWTKCIRETAHWSQEALAAASGLDVRTIQRIEAGQPISVTTRRALARGLGYDNPDIFDDPDFIKGMQVLIGGIRQLNDEQLKKEHPDHISIKAARVMTGDALARVAFEANAYLFHADEEIREDAKELAAIIFDFLRDLGDIGSELGFSERLDYQMSLGEQLAQLEAMGAHCFSAFRATKIVGANWKDKTPLPITIAYLTVVPANKEVNEMMVPRHVS